MSKTNQHPWWAKKDLETAPIRPRFRGVAYYRHSARDRQENSVAIQQEMIQEWAKQNGVEIIHEFADRGKSGLTAEGRDGFNDMMENWVKKRKDFDFVLCLDVSRWGRFQDIDLSATYNAEVKKHGKQVVYTTLGMPRPDDPLYPVYLQFERFLAAQFSSDLSRRVYHGCIKIAQQGYWNGGKPPYGLDRLLLDESRKPLHILQPHQKKGIANQRVTLTLGPEKQVATVRRIFSEFIDTGQSLEQIAQHLNEDAVHSPNGGTWERWSPAKILVMVRHLSRRNRPLTTEQMERRYCNLVSAARRHFGSWTKAALAAGVEPTKLQRVVPWNRERVIEAILTRALRNESLVAKFVEPCSLVEAGQRFFGGWPAAVTAAGLDPISTVGPPKPAKRSPIAKPPAIHTKTISDPRKPWTKERVIAEIHARLREQKPINSWALECDDPSLYSAVRRHLNSWKDAMLAAGLDPAVYQRGPAGNSQSTESGPA